MDTLDVELSLNDTIQRAQRTIRVGRSDDSKGDQVVTLQDTKDMWRLHYFGHYSGRLEGSQA